jgi:hypothetical protein
MKPSSADTEATAPLSNGEAVGPCTPTLSLGPPCTSAFGINPSPSPLSSLSPKTHSLPLSGPSQTSKKPCCSSSLRRASEGPSRSSAKTETVAVGATLPLSPLLSQYSSPYSRTQSLFFFPAEPTGRRSLKLVGAAACPGAGADQCDDLTSACKRFWAEFTAQGLHRRSASSPPPLRCPTVSFPTSSTVHYSGAARFRPSSTAQGR